MIAQAIEAPDSGAPLLPLPESITPEHLRILKARFRPREKTQPSTGVEVHI